MQDLQLACHCTSKQIKRWYHRARCEARKGNPVYLRTARLRRGRCKPVLGRHVLTGQFGPGQRGPGRGYTGVGITVVQSVEQPQTVLDQAESINGDARGV
jgi:hypothetical protein